MDENVFFKGMTAGTDQRHDDLLSEGVDGRVGDLSEQLLEVGEHQGVEVGQARQWRVITHGTQSLLPENNELFPLSDTTCHVRLQKVHQ